MLILEGEKDTNEEEKGAEAEDDAVAKKKKVGKCVEEEVAKKEITTRRLGSLKQVTNLSEGTEDIYFV